MMRRAFLLAACLLASCILAAVVATADGKFIGSDLDARFALFQREHARNYSCAQELQHRRAIFAHNVQLIERHNAHPGSLTYTLAVNQFADKSFDEWIDLVGSKPLPPPKQLDPQPHGKRAHRRPHMLQELYVRSPSAASSKGAAPRAAAATVAPPPPHSDNSTGLDWRAHHAVTGIKNQQSCGAAYAFASVAAIEGAFALGLNASSGALNNLTELSEQQIIDCSIGQGNEGCLSGTVQNALAYVLAASGGGGGNNGGLSTEAAYTYQSKASDCHATAYAGVALLSDVVALPSGNEAALLKAVRRGPVSVGVDCANEAWQFYSKGVLNDATCGSTINHYVAVIGFGTDQQAGPFWIIKNSWGPIWGEDGFARLARNVNQCGLSGHMHQPVLLSNNKHKQ